MLLLNGMPVSELHADNNLADEGISSYSQPTQVAISLDSISFGGIGNADPSDIAVLVELAIHEKAHKDFADYLTSVCAVDPPFWANVIQCHKAHSNTSGVGNACNESYATSRTATALCESLGTIDPESDEAYFLKDRLTRQMKLCQSTSDACEAANAACGPPEPPMPPDHTMCPESCEACPLCGQ